MGLFFFSKNKNGWSNILTIFEAHAIRNSLFLFLITFPCRLLQHVYINTNRNAEMFEPLWWFIAWNNKNHVRLLQDNKQCRYLSKKFNHWLYVSQKVCAFQHEISLVFIFIVFLPTPPTKWDNVLWHIPLMIPKMYRILTIQKGALI